MNDLRKGVSEHYNELYTKDVPFRMTPDPVVRDIPDPVSGEALDLGAGQGRNGIALAARGLNVLAIELSSVAVESINKKASDENLSIQAKVGDMTEMKWDREFDVIATTFTMHHILREDGVRLVGQMQKHTKPGGYNAIALFTQDGDFYRRDPDSVRFYPALGEMKELYSDWEIVSYSEVEGSAHAKKDDGTNMKNIVVRILARKPH